MNKEDFKYADRDITEVQFKFEVGEGGCNMIWQFNNMSTQIFACDFEHAIKALVRDVAAFTERDVIEHLSDKKLIKTQE